VAASGGSAYLFLMSTGKKDIDPTTELVEEEDEQSLPEEEQDPQ
jgi:hypothetical protein